MQRENILHQLYKFIELYPRGLKARSGKGYLIFTGLFHFHFHILATEGYLLMSNYCRSDCVKLGYFHRTTTKIRFILFTIDKYLFDFVYPKRYLLIKYLKLLIKTSTRVQADFCFYILLDFY